MYRPTPVTRLHVSTAHIFSLPMRPDLLPPIQQSSRLRCSFVRSLAKDGILQTRQPSWVRVITKSEESNDAKVIATSCALSLLMGCSRSAPTRSSRSINECGIPCRNSSLVENISRGVLWQIKSVWRPAAALPRDGIAPHLGYAALAGYIDAAAFSPVAPARSVPAKVAGRESTARAWVDDRERRLSIATNATHP